MRYRPRASSPGISTRADIGRVGSRINCSVIGAAIGDGRPAAARERERDAIAISIAGLSSRVSARNLSIIGVWW